MVKNLILQQMVYLPSTWQLINNYVSTWQQNKNSGLLQNSNLEHARSGKTQHSTLLNPTLVPWGASIPQGITSRFQLATLATFFFSYSFE